jgi:hypothetical protein
MEKCREVYFCVDDYSEASFVVTNFCLYSVFYEYGGMEKDASVREQHEHYIEMCRDNLETALANLNILMPATLESIMALTIGVSTPSPVCLLDIPRRDSLLTNKGYACTRDFQTIGWLDASIDSHESVPNTRISSRYINGARLGTSPTPKTDSILDRLHTFEYDVPASRTCLAHPNL